jgi:hypothetical protein
VAEAESGLQVEAAGAQDRVQFLDLVRPDLPGLQLQT